MFNLEKKWSYPWMRYSRKLSRKIEVPLHKGFFSREEAKQRGMRLVIGEAGELKKGNFLRLYWLIDEVDGIIADAKFQVYGQTALIGAAEAICELVIRKNYDQARRMNADFIDQHLRDKKDKEAFPEETYAHLNLALQAIDEASDCCMDIPLADSYVPPPVARIDANGEHSAYPNWDSLSMKQQISVIEEIIASDIRPYIELDAGGIEILSFLNGRELLIAYKGACTSCYSATGATLEAIQQILRSKVHPDIQVIPDLSFLHPTSHHPDSPFEQIQKTES
jgi:NifU-like protein